MTLNPLTGLSAFLGPHHFLLVWLMRMGVCGRTDLYMLEAVVPLLVWLVMLLQGQRHCLDSNSDPLKCAASSSKEVGLPIVVGSGVGGLALGTLVGILAAYLCLKRKYKKK